MRWTRDHTTVRWVGGGLLIDHRGDAVLLDAPPGVVAAIGPDLARLRSVLLTGGRIQNVGGLVPLLDALTPHRDGASMDVHTVLGEERSVALAETWARAWGSPYPLVLDAERPGAFVEVGRLTIELLPMKAGEPDWATASIRSRVQVAARITTPDATISWVPGAAPNTAVPRACAGSDLAVVEVGVLPWPTSPIRWRLTPTEALQAAAQADTAWLFGDDGKPLTEVDT